MARLSNVLTILIVSALLSYVQNVHGLRGSFSQKPSFDEQLIDLKLGQSRLLFKAQQFDYKNVQANGLRSLAKVIDKFVALELKVTAFSQGARHLRTLTNIMKLLNHTVRIMELYASGRGSETVQQLLNIDPEHLKSMFEVGPFYLELPLWLSLKLFLRIVAFTIHGVEHSQLISANEYASSIAAYYALNADYVQLRRAEDVLDSELMRTIAAKISPVQTFRTVQIPTKTSSHNSHVSCQLIRDSNLLENDVLFHLHGGGFITMNASSHQMFLRTWTRDTKTMATLTPDYSLSPEAKFPVALEEVSQVYKFVVSSSPELFRLLGFKIRNVVIFGNSAGGNLAVSLCRLLLRMSLPLPSALVLVNPYIVPSISWSLPSRALMAIDSNLPPSTFFVMTDAYAPRHGEANRGPWYRTVRSWSRMEEVDTMSRAEPLLNPLVGSFDGLEELPLSIIVGEFDPLLDDAVALAKKWPRDVDLVVVDGLTHGFLFNAGMSVMATRASDHCLEVIRKHFNC